jgi:hypothetical protein
MLYQGRQSLAKMGQQERRLYNKGFPVWAVTHNEKTRPLVFQDYNVGVSTPRVITAIMQENAIDHPDCMIENRTVVMYSAPTDREAFRAAGRMALEAIRQTRSIECISVMDIVSNWREIPKAMCYYIYGIDENMAAGTASAVRSFLYARDGSLRVLIVAGSDPNNPRGPWDIVTKKLHVSADVLFVLSESESTINAGRISKSPIGSSRNVQAI